MSLEIEDGFNFAIGQYIADVMIAGICVISVLTIIGISYGVYGLYEYIKYKVRK